MYFLLILAAALLSVFFVLNKIYEKYAGSSLFSGFAYNALLGAMIAVIFFGLSGFKFEITLYSAIMAVAMTVLVIGYTLLGFQILKDGSVAIYSIFLMTGGMTVPYIYGLLFLDEEFSILRTVGLVALISAVVLSNFGKRGERVGLSRIVMCVIVFFLNGFVSVISKLHQIETEFPTVGAESFVMLGGIAKFVLAGSAVLIIMIIEKCRLSGSDKSENEKAALPKEKTYPLRANLKILVPIIVAAAVVDGVSYLFQLKGAAELPAGVLYPTVTGASMIFSAIADFIVFRKKPTKFVLISVCLCFAGTLIFAI